MRLIDADALKEWFYMNIDFGGWENNHKIQNDIDKMPTIDAIPLGCLELEKRDCGFSDQCDMGSSFTRQRERACKEIIDWYGTPSYQRCVQVAKERGFIDKYSHKMEVQE